LSRQDHRNYDASLEKSRNEAKFKEPSIRREKRDRALTLFLALLGIGLSFVGILWAASCWLICLFALAAWIGNTERLRNVRRPWVRLMQVSIIVGVVAVGGFPVYQRWRTEQAVAVEGDLIGAGPAVNDGKQHGFPMLQVGGTTWVMTPDGVADIFPFFRDSGVRIEWGYKGPLLTTPVRDRNGNLLAEITRNHWRIYPLYCADKNYRKDALEIKDSAGHVVLQVRILPDRIRLQGEWWDTQGNGIRLLSPPNPTPSAGSIVIPLNRQNQHIESLIQPMFEYPSKDHWQEFVH